MSEHEFSKEENVIVGNLAKRMAWVGLLIAIWYVILLINIVVSAISASEFSIIDTVDVVDCLLFIIMGITLYRPTDNLKRIVTTKGQDISELMTAFGEINVGLRAMMILLALHLILSVFVSLFIG